MPKLTQRQVNLHKAEEKLNKVSKRSKQFHLRFDRVQKGKRYKTTVKIERGDRNYSGNNHGLIHRTVNLKHRVIGDVPSVTKAVNTAGRAAVHTAVNTGLKIQKHSRFVLCFNSSTNRDLTSLQILIKFFFN